MKKMICLLSACLLLAGCSTDNNNSAKPQEEASAPASSVEEVSAAPEETVDETNEETAAETPLLGAWETFTDFNSYLTDEEMAVFDLAVDSLLGVSYTPVDVLATQLVSGTNYAYLAQGTTIGAESSTGYYVVVVYRNLSDELEVTAINPIDLNDIKVTEAAAGEMVGAWEIRGTGKAGMLPGADLQESFDLAMGDTLRNPIAILGTQEVNGMNYVALARAHAANPNDTEIRVVSWHAGTDGSAEVISDELFDLNYYVTAK